MRPAGSLHRETRRPLGATVRLPERAISDRCHRRYRLDRPVCSKQAGGGHRGTKKYCARRGDSRREERVQLGPVGQHPRRFTPFAPCPITC
ncbi:unnamed protein product [Trichogramma brassicae]|uniref:Uncharacterized protein n=1 Tax=Trichogramma brassicae TaxID=86971 RepID=A0A6H5HSQ5_9HYME|nr:unnamed protein product [Trichogramma brassicae]